jgi:hypothetical protein
MQKREDRKMRREREREREREKDVHIKGAFVEVYRAFEWRQRRPLHKFWV